MEEGEEGGGELIHNWRPNITFPLQIHLVPRGEKQEIVAENRQ